MIFTWFRSAVDDLTTRRKLQPFNNWPSRLKQSRESTCLIPEFDSNVKHDSELHRATAYSSIGSTLGGTQILATAEFGNAFESIRFNEQFVSNVISRSDLQYEKHDEPIIATFFGMQM
jgi:hypothetical protein